MDEPIFRLWQRGYYDHIVRDEDSLKRIRENPAPWRDDEENPLSASATAFQGALRFAPTWRRNNRLLTE